MGVIEALLHDLTICPGCGRLGGRPFCAKCWDLRLGQSNLKVRFMSGGYIPLLYLFSWDHQCPWVGHLIHSLKGGFRQSTFRDLAVTIAVEYHRCFGDWPAELAFVPAPPKPERIFRRDHAMALAEALAEVTGGQVHAILRRENGKSQKRKTGLERQGLRFFIKEGARVPKGPIVFVDDLVTTGATVSAAYKALSGPINFTVWAVAYRAQNPVRACTRGETHL